MRDSWHGCYRGGWGRNLVPEAFAHPAKVAFGLSELIFAHMREERWIAPGSVILDPFAGIGGFALQAMLAGCEFIGVELEPKFVTLAEQNITLWNSRYAGRIPGWGSAVILQGDSRRLLAWQFAGAKVDGCVSSPPYAGSLDAKGDGIDWTKARRGGHSAELGTPRSPSRGAIADGYGAGADNLGNMPEGDVDAVISSPPFLNQVQAQDPKYQKAGDTHGPRHSDYGSSPGQLGQMCEGEFEEILLDTKQNPATMSICRNVERAESQSLEEVSGAGSVPTRFGVPRSRGGKSQRVSERKSGRPDLINRCQIAGGRLTQTGREEAQLGEDTLGGFCEEQPSNEMGTNASSACLTSESKSIISKADRKPEDGGTTHPTTSKQFVVSVTSQSTDLLGYGEPAQSAENEQKENRLEDAARKGAANSPSLPPRFDSKISGLPDNFWCASRQILEQVFLAMKPGGHAVFVVKAFVRKGKLVDFPGQWRQLCEAVGFRCLHVHRALLTEEYGTQINTKGDHETHRIKRASFFRRLAEKKGSPRIDWEEVQCFERP